MTAWTSMPPWKFMPPSAIGGVRVDMCTAPSLDFGECLHSWCCMNPAFGCFKRLDRVSAAHFVSGQRLPARMISNLSSAFVPVYNPSHPTLLPTQSYAECRPMARNTKAGKCVDGDGWVCPESWMHKLPLVVSPPPPIRARVDKCVDASAAFESCYDSWCCEGPGFGCFKRVGKVRAYCMCCCARTLLRCSQSVYDPTCVPA